MNSTTRFVFVCFVVDVAEGASVEAMTANKCGGVSNSSVRRYWGGKDQSGYFNVIHVVDADVALWDQAAASPSTPMGGFEQVRHGLHCRGLHVLDGRSCA